MKDYRGYFGDKKITLMGLGLLGRGVGDAKFLAEMGAELIVTDLKTEEELQSSLAQLKQFPNITYVLGEHRLEDFRNRDFILKAAGVPLDSRYIEEAKKGGIPIKMSASWFAELVNIPTLGVTGTRGKSTVTHMIDAILKASGKHVLLGGNVRGVSTLALLPEVTPESVALMELDSWQLQGFGDAQISPYVAVFTTFFDDHLNYYDGDREIYLKDKAQIFLYQKPGDTFVLGAQAKDAVLGSHEPPIEPQIVDASIVDGWDIPLPGEHNRYDAACAVVAAKAMGIDEEVCRRALEKFVGVPGRLELVHEVDLPAQAGGVKIYNDTTATSPEATIAALKALDLEGKKNIVLIAGGADKGLDMNQLLLEIPRRTKRVILLAGTGTGRVLEYIEGASVFDSLNSAVTEALQAAESGDVILFSPAFASFGMFKNEYDRGDQFTALVKEL